MTALGESVRLGGNPVPIYLVKPPLFLLTSRVNRVNSSDDPASLEDAHDYQRIVGHVGQHDGDRIAISDLELDAEVGAEGVGELEGLLVSVAAAGHWTHLEVCGQR